MTEHTAPSPAAPPPPTVAPVQEYPKMLYRDPPAHEPDTPPETIVVDDKTAEEREKKDGYLDAAEFEKARAAAHETKRAKK